MMFPPQQRGRGPNRTRRASRPTVEALEMRLALARTPLDPTFGTGGVALAAVAATARTDFQVDATAVQPDGKVVVVESSTSGDARTTTGVTASLVVLRYDADGSVDPTFGAGGQTSIPIPGPYNAFATVPFLSSGPDGAPVATPRNVAIAPDGGIVLAAGLTQLIPQTTPDSTAGADESLIVRLTATGRLDAAFAAGGEYVVPTAGAVFSTVAVQADGKVVAGGSMALGVTPTATSRPLGMVLRLTTAGVPDPTFAGTGELTLTTTPVAADRGGSNFIAGLALDASGRIVVAGIGSGTAGAFTSQSFAARITAAGVQDPTFGTGGVAFFPAPDNSSPTPGDFNGVAALAVQPDGGIILAGYRTGDLGVQSPTLARLTPAGAVDATFARPAAAAADERFAAIAVDPASGAITVAGTASVGLTEVSLVERFLATGALDPGFGTAGRATLVLDPTPVAAPTPTAITASVGGLALTATGRILVAGILTTRDIVEEVGRQPLDVQQPFLARLLPIATTRPVAGDYDGDGRADIAAQLAAFGLFAYRESAGGGDVVEPFGPAGVDQAIPAPGDYDGDGRTDLAVYLPAYGILAYRPSSGGPDVLTQFGTPGAGNSIPAPGDYDGDGRTDVAVYLPAAGILAYRPSHGGGDVLVRFGTPGDGNSIPAPGDYNGDGFTDVAVYLPAYGVLAYRPSYGGDTFVGSDVLIPFGMNGPGASIPAPGDYDGDGKTDVAVYLPSQGVYAYRPSSRQPNILGSFGGADVVESFGTPGPGASIPAPGDYDGDGKTDVAVYLPGFGLMASRPSSGGADVITQFGIAGAGQTIPAASLPPAAPTTADATVSASSVVAIPLLSPDAAATADPGATPASRRKSRGGLA